MLDTDGWLTIGEFMKRNPSKESLLHAVQAIDTLIGSDAVECSMIIDFDELKKLPVEDRHLCQFDWQVIEDVCRIVSTIYEITHSEISGCENPHDDWQQTKHQILSQQTYYKYRVDTDGAKR